MTFDLVIRSRPLATIDGMSSGRDPLGRYQTLGVTTTSVPIPPVKDVEAFMGHAQWVIEEIEPKLS